MYTALNNSSMKTVVETFVIEETQELIYDNEKLDQWNKHVSSLGLKGQTKIVAPEKSPIPFLHMKLPLVRVFETLCPRKVDIVDYDKTPIPVEILDLVALSKREQYFTKIEIWYDDETPDPACVGYIGKYYTYDRSYKTMAFYPSREEAERAKASDANVYGTNFSTEAQYLIGRWADVKMSLPELTAKAKAIYVQERTDNFNKEILKAQRGIADLEMDANSRFGYTVENNSSFGI
jgi:hypothetical protein